MNPWAGLTALALVLVTLLTLVLVPILVQRRVDRLRAEVEAAEPARTLVTRLQYNLVREMAALSELMLSGDEAYLQTYAEARAGEDTTYVQLAPLARRLGPEVQGRFTRARELADLWHARTASPDNLRRNGGRWRSPLEMPRQRRLFEEVLRATAAVDTAIVQATASKHARIAATERAGVWMTVLLGVLALMAAGAAAALYGRVRRFAAESERRREQAEFALAESARAEEARARLLRGVTHDVKNPLGAAKGYAELLAMGARGPMPPEQARLVEGVQRTVDTALAIIGDLLDVARADSGMLRLNRVRADLSQVAHAAAEIHRAAAEAAGHRLVLEAADEGLEVYTDPARVRQILDNLFSNAIKYTPRPGVITVRTEIVSNGNAPRAGRWAAVRVTDTGPGVRHDLQETIFDEFTRLDENAKTQGHGLGLAIARRIARLLGGDLSVESTAGSGSTFTLWLPCREPKNQS